MKRLEDELKNALRRVEPPEDFASRTLLKINETPQRTRFSLFYGQRLRWAFAAGIVLLLLAAGAGTYRHVREERRAFEERRRGEEAKEQLMLALSIAAEKLQFVQTRVRQINWNYQVQEEGD